MSTADRAAGLMDRARSLAQSRRWAELARLADECTPDEIMGAAELEYLLADALRRTGRTDEALTLAGRAETGAGRLADRRLVLRAINLLGMLAYESGRVAEAEARFDRLLERASEWGDDEFVARASNNLGVLANVRGERELALTFYQRALAAYYRLGHSRGLAQTHYNIGISYRDLGFLEDAERHYTGAIRYAGMADSDDVIALAETERALLRVAEGDGPLAESLALRALRRLQRMGDPVGGANAVRVLALAAEARSDSDTAMSRLDQALTITLQHPDLLLSAEIQRDRARLLAAAGDAVAATAALREALDAFTALGASAEAAATRDLLAGHSPADAPPSSSSE
jgi:tetratricopeptide (TPR) repeat protein